jgi:hypothetical protein
LQALLCSGSQHREYDVMARRIRMHGLADIVAVSDPADIREITDQPGIDRNFVSRGPLMNRMAIGKIRRWFRFPTDFLPVLSRRDDPIRAKRTAEIAQQLEPASGRHFWDENQIKILSGYVRGDVVELDANIVMQQIVGCQFNRSYRADADTWKAAEMIDQFRGGFSLVQIWWRLSGKLQRAFDLLFERAGKDRWCMHGTAIGIHGIVQAIARLREFRADPQLAALSADEVVWKCLLPPKAAPRTVEAKLQTMLDDAPLVEGTVIMLQLEAAAIKEPGPEMVFMEGHWNACPAQSFIVTLIKDIWVRSAEIPA